ncbi:LLM class flavin-dependent oxidoreductase [Microbacterium mangrovi]|uniref:LLM class flavin-dependent oxidoreductase n=1 Tax=Microbacterium mangrovi TaxID=1348253 RepID=UPI00068957A5|nr:LLM class flavin-dependent oxidoreductase [Microbacterium mangrovi]
MSTRLTSESLTIALYAILDEPGDQAQKYLDALDLFEHAERIGIDGVWVRQFHLTREPRHAGLPSPFVFLAALAARTTRLRLGTAAVTLPLESPLRVAEDAAVLDALSGGRVELGIANGSGAPGTAELLGRPPLGDVEDRKAAYAADVRRLTDGLRGADLDGTGATLTPPTVGLADRIWEATLSDRSGRETGRRGNGVLLGTTQTVPAEVTARAYFAGLEDRGRTTGETVPRVGLATLIYPAVSRGAALREARDGIEQKYAWGKDFLPRATTLAEKAASINLHYGTSEQILESIHAQPAFPYATQLLVQTELFYGSWNQRKDAIEQFATEVAPALGWRCALATGVRA